MGMICSVNEALSNLRWTTLAKGRPAQVEKALSLGDYGVLLKLKNGEFTVIGGRHVPNGPYAVTRYTNKTVLNGLVRIGALTREQVDEHLAHTEKVAQDDERNAALASLRRSCKTLGIGVPKVK